MPDQENPGTARVVLVVLALATRLAAALALGGGVHFADEADYVDCARSLLAGNGFGASYRRAPAYPVFLALLSRSPGGGTAFLRVAQATLLALGAVLTFELGRRIFGRRPAVVAGLLYALDPLLVVAAGLLYPDALAAPVLLATLLAALHAVRRDRVGASAAAGLFLGVLTLLRPVSTAILPVLALWALTGALPRRRRALHALAVGLVYCLALAPWVYRNYRVEGALVPIATAGQESAAVPVEELHRRGVTAALLRTAWAEPLGLAGHVGREFLHFWELYPTRLATDRPADLARMHQSDPRLPLHSRFAPALRDPVSAVSFGGELLLAAVGIAVAWRQRPRETALLIAVILSYALGYTLFAARLRYRIAVLPELFVLAGAAAAIHRPRR